MPNKQITKILILAVMFLYSLSAMAQEEDPMVEGINTALSKGDCENAQKLYQIWKNTDGVANAAIEKRIAECGKNAINNKEVIPAEESVLEKLRKSNLGEPADDTFYKPTTRYGIREIGTTIEMVISLDDREYYGGGGHIKFESNITGTITVVIIVDRYGDVTNAYIGSPTSVSSTGGNLDKAYNVALNNALKCKFSSGTGTVKGTVRYEITQIDRAVAKP
jgi:hypothetical protein